MDAEDEFEHGQGRGEGLAHRLVRFVGRWPFAVALLVFITSWVFWNLLGRPFEPYPLIIGAVLGPVLASLAGLRGPVIIMSQRYQRERDRQRSKVEYLVLTLADRWGHATEVSGGSWRTCMLRPAASRRPRAITAGS